MNRTLILIAAALLVAIPLAPLALGTHGTHDDAGSGRDATEGNPVPLPGGESHGGLGGSDTTDVYSIAVTSPETLRIRVANTDPAQEHPSMGLGKGSTGLGTISARGANEGTLRYDALEAGTYLLRVSSPGNTSYSLTFERESAPPLVTPTVLAPNLRTFSLVYGTTGFIASRGTTIVDVVSGAILAEGGWFVDLAVDGDGDVLAREVTKGSFREVSSGLPIARSFDNVGRSLIGLAFGPDGELYTHAYQSGTLQRLVVRGDPTTVMNSVPPGAGAFAPDGKYYHFTNGIESPAKLLAMDISSGTLESLGADAPWTLNSRVAVSTEGKIYFSAASDITMSASRLYMFDPASGRSTLLAEYAGSTNSLAAGPAGVAIGRDLGSGAGDVLHVAAGPGFIGFRPSFTPPASPDIAVEVRIERGPELAPGVANDVNEVRNVVVTLRNVGAAPTDASFYVFVWEPKSLQMPLAAATGILTPRDFGMSFTDTLAVGESAEITWTWDVSRRAGEVRLAAVVDGGGNQLLETEERANNVAETTTTIRVREPPTTLPQSS